MEDTEVTLKDIKIEIIREWQASSFTLPYSGDSCDTVLLFYIGGWILAAQITWSSTLAKTYHSAEKGEDTVSLLTAAYEWGPL
jgi:hypothetical protein